MKLFSRTPLTMLGADTSNLTSDASVSIRVSDAFAISLSIQSSTGSASRYTIVASNQDEQTSGYSNPQLQTTPWGTWSIITTITAQGIYSITPGFRWIAAFRDAVSVSASSNVTMILNYQEFL